MNPVRLIRALTQPAKTATILFYVSFLPLLAAVPTQAGWLFVFPGTGLFLWSLCMATNINGGATITMHEMTDPRPGRIDLTKTFLATTAYVRVCGVLGMVMGAVIIFASLSMPV